MLTNRSGSTTSGQRNERPDPKKLNADCLKNRQLGFLIPKESYEHENLH